LDSESEAAKKFGCGTTRFKTMWVVWYDDPLSISSVY
jgi:hypothetical protein